MELGKNDLGLKEIWEGVFNVYLAVARICDKNNLRYYVSDGCALGSVRHGGFIPWDDDFDISMPRLDYEKFLRIADKELPSHLKVVTRRNTPEYYMLFAKIQDCREDYIRKLESSYGSQLSNGIYIDILPIDGTSRSSLVRYCADKWFRLRRMLMRFRCDVFSRQTVKGKFYWLIGGWLMIFFPWLWKIDNLLESYEKSAKRYTFDDSDLTIRPCSNISYRRKPIRKSVWGCASIGKFGEMFIKLPQDVEQYLRVEYGDYMKMPPEAQRVPGHQYSQRCPWWLGPTTDRRSS